MKNYIKGGTEYSGVSQTKTYLYRLSFGARRSCCFGLVFHVFVCCSWIFRMSKRKNLTIFNYFEKRSRPEICEVTASSTNVSCSVEQKCDTSVEENVSSITISDECESDPQSVSSHPHSYDIGLFFRR